jgi:KaiC/GvpD/RAD55 family RecA-like ATPase
MLDKSNVLKIEKQLKVAEKSLNTEDILLTKTANGLGKTLLAVSIADKITKGQKSFLNQKIEETKRVLFIDIELSQRQFLNRYKNHNFSPEFYRAELNPDYLGKEVLDIEYIKHKLEYHQAEILILDNISALSLRNTEDTQIAIEIMRGLKMLSRKGITCLVLAHTPKHFNNEKVHVDHVAGSKYLTNFADSVFFIAESQVSPNFRYLKMTKSRDSERMQDVLLCRIEETNNRLEINFVQYDDEENHRGNGTSIEDKIALVKKLTADGLSLRQIEKETGIARATVARYLKGK